METIRTIKNVINFVQTEARVMCCGATGGKASEDCRHGPRWRCDPLHRPRPDGDRPAAPCMTADPAAGVQCSAPRSEHREAAERTARSCFLASWGRRPDGAWTLSQGIPLSVLGVAVRAGVLGTPAGKDQSRHPRVDELFSKPQDPVLLGYER